MEAIDVALHNSFVTKNASSLFRENRWKRGNGAMEFVVELEHSLISGIRTGQNIGLPRFHSQQLIAQFRNPYTYTFGHKNWVCKVCSKK